MPEELNTVTLGENELRLETLALPNGNTYILGCSFEEAQEIYRVLSENIEAVNDELEENEQVVAASLNDLNSRIVTLTQENTSLKNEIANLKNEIESIKKEYMAYYAVDESKGIGENNTYSIVNG